MEKITLYLSFETNKVEQHLKSFTIDLDSHFSDKKNLFNVFKKLKKNKIEPFNINKVWYFNNFENYTNTIDITGKFLFEYSKYILNIDDKIYHFRGE